MEHMTVGCATYNPFAIGRTIRLIFREPTYFALKTPIYMTREGTREESSAESQKHKSRGFASEDLEGETLSELLPGGSPTSSSSTP
jgi:hypothetical protein